MTANNIARKAARVGLTTQSAMLASMTLAETFAKRGECKAAVILGTSAGMLGALTMIEAAEREGVELTVADLKVLLQKTAKGSFEIAAKLAGHE